MSASFAFGNVGDIIAICQISCALGKALSDSRGSAQEYRKLCTTGGLFRGYDPSLRSLMANARAVPLNGRA
jgi:hypothetical protein